MLTVVYLVIGCALAALAYHLMTGGFDAYAARTGPDAAHAAARLAAVRENHRAAFVVTTSAICLVIVTLWPPVVVTLLVTCWPRRSKP